MWVLSLVHDWCPKGNMVLSGLSHWVLQAQEGMSAGCSLGQQKAKKGGTTTARQL